MNFDEWLDKQLALSGMTALVGVDEHSQIIPRFNIPFVNDYTNLLKLVRAYHELDCINAELYPDADWKKRGEIAALQATLMGEDK